MKKTSLVFYAVSPLFGLFCGCMSQQPIGLYVSEHNQNANHLRVLPYEANASTIVKKPDYPEDFLYVDFFVILKNDTNNNIYIGEEQFTIGYYNIELEIIRRNKPDTRITLKKREGLWHRNFTSLLIIPPHAMLAYPISLDKGIWEGLPDFAIGEELLIKARLHLRRTKMKDQMMRLFPSSVESDWGSVIYKEKRLAHISEIQLIE
jgi:hypothetical protein